MPSRKTAPSRGRKTRKSSRDDAGSIGNAESAKLEALLRTAVDAIISIDAKGIMSTVNPAAEQLFGYAASELIGSNISMLMPEPHRSRHDAYIGHHLRTGERRIIGLGREVHGLRKDGTEFPLHLSVSAFEFGGQKFFTGIIHDLTLRKAHEREIERQKGQLEAIFNGIRDALFVTDADGRIRFSNPAAQGMFGMPPEAFVDLPCAQLFLTERDHEQLRQAMAASAPNGVHQPITCTYKRANGDTFPGATVMVRINEGGGTSIGYLCQVRDITREQQHDAMLRRAQKLEAVGQLTGGLAHDFNNLLTVIIGNLELLEIRSETEADRALIKDALEASEMGHRLTDRLLTFSRRRALEPEVIDLNGVVLDLIDMLRRTLGATIAVGTSLKTDLWRTKADRGQVENAILNLAINARDAMPKGGKLAIETRNVRLDQDSLPADSEMKPGDYVRLTITDAGSGMPAEVRDRAFEPFFTTKEKGRGTGLGLATVYGFARQSGGNATIYSELSKGTSVSIYLPKDAASQSQLPDDPRIIAPASATHRHILVVDDDERVRRLAVSRLEALGHRVTQCDSGAAALDQLASIDGIDLVFTDLTMPGGVSGIDLCRIVRERYPQCGLLLTSGFAEELVDPDSIERLKVRFLRKPYRQADLVEAIALALGDRAQ